MGLTCPDRRARVASAWSCSSGWRRRRLQMMGAAGCKEPDRLLGLSLLGEATIVERARVRCSTCRSVVPLTVLWAVGESCPRCSQPLYAANRRPTPDDFWARRIALLHAEAASKSRSSGLARR